MNGRDDARSGHDEALFDDVAVLALGALPPAEAARVAAHIRECAACRKLYAQLCPAADRIGYSAEELTDVDALAAARRKKRIMASVRESAAASIAITPGALQPQRRGTVLPWSAAAAAILIAGGLGVWNAELRSDYARAARVAQQASTQRTVLAQDVFGLLGPGAKRYAVPEGVVIVRDGRLYVALHGLAQPPEGRVYQTWTLASGAKAMTPGATFRPNGDGIALIELGVSAQAVAAVALSIEPAGGSRAPTTKPTFVRKLS